MLFIPVIVQSSSLSHEAGALPINFRYLLARFSAAPYWSKSVRSALAFCRCSRARYRFSKGAARPCANDSFYRLPARPARVFSVDVMFAAFYPCFHSSSAGPIFPPKWCQIFYESARAWRLSCHRGLLPASPATLRSTKRRRADVPIHVLSVAVCSASMLSQSILRHRLETIVWLVLITSLLT